MRLRSRLLPARRNVAGECLRLARRPDAQSFRIAWDIAMDNAVRRIGDEAFSRCIHGVAVPHFYQGQQIGEHRRYDERLTMFILRYRDPARYGRHLDGCGYDGVPEEKALDLADALAWVEADARREAAGLPRRVQSEFAADNDDEGAGAGPPRNRTNIYRWAPKPPNADAGWDASSEDDDPRPTMTGRRQSLRTWRQDRQLPAKRPPARPATAPPRPPRPPARSRGRRRRRWDNGRAAGSGRAR